MLAYTALAHVWPCRKEGAQVGLRGVAVERLRSQRRGLWTRHQGRNAHRDRLQADHQDPTLQDPLQLEEEVWRWGRMLIFLWCPSAGSHLSHWCTPAFHSSKQWSQCERVSRLIGGATRASRKNTNNHPALSLGFWTLDCATFAGGMSFSDMPQRLLFPQ